MAAEIESKYICKELPKGLDHIDYKILWQGYIHIDPTKQVRVRLVDNTAKMCIKFMSGNYRDEFEATIDYEEGLKLYNLCKYKVVKRRYSLQLPDGCHCDIDLYDDGTKIVEVERPTLEFVPDLPDWIGECVDGQWRYNNYYFAGFPEKDYINIQTDII